MNGTLLFTHMNTIDQESQEHSEEELIIDMNQEFADGQQVEMDFEDEEEEGGFVFEFEPEEE